MPDGATPPRLIPLPRLVSLADARAYLNGIHPATLGIPCVRRGTYDRRALDAALDRLAGLSPPPAAPDPGASPSGGPDDTDTAGELVDLAARIAERAAARNGARNGRAR